MLQQHLARQESPTFDGDKIPKTKKTFHEKGISSLLWGSAIAICGIWSFAQMQLNIYLIFDVWFLALAAIIPQAWLTVKEFHKRNELTQTQAALNNVWLVYGISILALVFYFNAVPWTTNRQLFQEGRQLFEREPVSGIETPFQYFIASSGSLLLLLYPIPTLITGLTVRFLPMIIGAVLCYVFFVASLYTDTKYDMLFNGLAAIANWLIPGIILYRRYLKEKDVQHV